MHLLLPCEKTCPTGAVKMTETGEVNEKTKKPIKQAGLRQGQVRRPASMCVDVCPKDCLTMKEAM